MLTFYCQKLKVININIKLIINIINIIKINVLNFLLSEIKGYYY